MLFVGFEKNVETKKSSQNEFFMGKKKLQGNF